MGVPVSKTIFAFCAAIKYSYKVPDNVSDLPSLFTIRLTKLWASSIMTTVLSNGLIKNNHKLTTSHITCITNDDMRDADDNLNIFKEDVIKILKYSNEPIFIAHNGKRFDL